MNTHLHFTQSLEPLRGGGLGMAAANLHLSFLNGGIPSQLISTHENPKSVAPRNAYVGPVRGPSKCFYSPNLLENAQTILNEADIFHGHGFYVYPNWVIGKYARKKKKPLVYHPHGFFEPWILKRSKWPKRIAHCLFENANFKYAGLWRALTSKEADQTRAIGITAPIVVAPNGIHLEQFEKPISLCERFQKDKRRKRMLFLARLHPKKGLKMLLEVWANLPQSLVKDWEIVVAGPDEDGHLAELQETCSANNLNDTVSFVGTVTGDTKLAWFHTSDLFILPSYSEGFSVAILEAMACNLPVLATTACNFPEIAQEGGGWVCEPDHESLTGSLQSALAVSDQELQDRGNKARSLTESRFTWVKIAKDLSEACNAEFR